jgi:hypothetical protein
MGAASHDELVALVRDWRRARNGHVIVAAGESELTLLVDHGRAQEGSVKRAAGVAGVAGVASVELAVIRRGTNDLEETFAAPSSDAALMGVFL